MCVHMVGAILRVVFEDEDGGVIPVGAVRDSIHDAAERQIVIGHGGRGTRKVRTRAARVIVGQIQQDEGRQLELRPLVRLAGAHEGRELVQEFVGAKLVGIFGVEVRK